MDVSGCLNSPCGIHRLARSISSSMSRRNRQRSQFGFAEVLGSVSLAPYPVQCSSFTYLNTKGQAFDTHRREGTCTTSGRGSTTSGGRRSRRSAYLPIADLRAGTIPAFCRRSMYFNHLYVALAIIVCFWWCLNNALVGLLFVYLFVICFRVQIYDGNI